MSEVPLWLRSMGLSLFWVGFIGRLHANRWRVLSQVDRSLLWVGLTGHFHVEFAQHTRQTNFYEFVQNTWQTNLYEFVQNTRQTNFYKFV